MTDSIVLYCPVRPATTDVERLPYKGQIEVDQDGVLGRIQGEAIEVPSPYTLSLIHISDSARCIRPCPGRGSAPGLAGRPPAG